MGIVAVQVQHKMKDEWGKKNNSRVQNKHVDR